MKVNGQDQRDKVGQSPWDLSSSLAVSGVCHPARFYLYIVH